MSYFETVKYDDYLYQIKDKLGVLATLVIGETKALLLDTCYGIGNLKEEVENITSKPLIVVNSHGHMDHSCGNYQFSEVYIHPYDINLANKHNSFERRKQNLLSAKAQKILPIDFDEEAYLSQNAGNLKPLEIGQIFDLGNLKCEVLPLYGHTQGSIALYIASKKLMLVSDGTCPFVWLFLKESTTVTEYITNLKNILKYDFDNFLVGHGARLLPKKRMYSFLEIAETIDLEKSIRVSFNNFDNLNSYCYSHDKLYDQNGCGIVFDPNKL